MREIVYFILGVAVGSLVTLLLAPESGQEVRTKIQSAAKQDYASMQAEWQKEANKIHQRMDQLQAKIHQDS